MSKSKKKSARRAKTTAKLDKPIITHKKTTADILREFINSPQSRFVVFMTGVLLIVYLSLVLSYIGHFKHSLEVNNDFYKRKDLVVVKYEKLETDESTNAVIKTESETERIYFGEDSIVYYGGTKDSVLYDKEKQKYYIALGRNHLLEDGLVNFSQFWLILICCMINIVFIIKNMVYYTKTVGKLPKFLFHLALVIALVTISVITVMQQVNVFGVGVIEYWK